MAITGKERVTVPYLFQLKERGEKITVLTAYDFPTARILDESGIDIILVGDSLGMAVLGYETTLPVTMEAMIHHTQAVTRARRRALVIGDMPFLSFHLSLSDSLFNAGRFIKEGQMLLNWRGPVPGDWSWSRLWLKLKFRSWAILDLLPSQ